MIPIELATEFYRSAVVGEDEAAAAWTADHLERHLGEDKIGAVRSRIRNQIHGCKLQ